MNIDDVMTVLDIEVIDSDRYFSASDTSSRVSTTDSGGLIVAM
jgi:hypothetical protein